MASKADIFKSALEICTKYKASKELVSDLTELLEPRNGGAVVDWDEVLKKDGNGDVIEMLCSVSDVWLPATAEFFYTDTQGKGAPGTDKLKRLSKQGELIRRNFGKAINATEKAVMSDVLGGKMKPEAGKKIIDDARAGKPDYTKVSKVLPTKEDTKVQE